MRRARHEGAVRGGDGGGRAARDARELAARGGRGLRSADARLQPHGQVARAHSHQPCPAARPLAKPRRRVVRWIVVPESEGSGGEHKHRTPSLALVPPSAYPMRERSPVPCAQPSPRGDAPSPLAFAKSCKGGDVSVLDPALAWDVRCIYLFKRQATNMGRWIHRALNAHHTVIDILTNPDISGRSY